MSAHAYQRVTDALDARGSAGNGRQRQCPAHEDRVASLTVTDRPDRVLIHCHAGCDTLDVLEALHLDWPDTFDERRTGKGWKTSTLRRVGAKANGDGRITLGNVRYLPGAASSQKTRAARGAKRDLWPDPATINGEVLYVVEGEPDAVTAHQLGLPAVAVPGTGASFDWSWAERIAAGRTRVVLIADSDPPGRRAAAKWATAIAEHCPDVRVLDLDPQRNDGYDLSDFAGEAGNDVERENARRLIEAAAETVKPWIYPTQATHPTQTALGLERDVSDVLDVSDKSTPGTAELLAEIGRFLTRFVVLPSDEAADLLALWVLHTQALEARARRRTCGSRPRRPGSGKTLLLEVLAAICRERLARRQPERRGAVPQDRPDRRRCCSTRWTTTRSTTGGTRSRS